MAFLMCIPLFLQQKEIKADIKHVTDGLALVSPQV